MCMQTCLWKVAWLATLPAGGRQKAQAGASCRCNQDGVQSGVSGGFGMVGWGFVCRMASLVGGCFLWF